MRNIPNWDEFDTVLAFLLTVDSGAHTTDLLKQFFAVDNEHRTLVSRLIYATAYWAGDEIDFALLAVIGNLFLVAVFAQLLALTRDGAARLRLAAIFALVVFQLQHHESLFWSGSSIDHFFVILAAVSALGALTARGTLSFVGGCAAAMLATFSLAHGLLVWPIGLVLLAVDRRWRAAAAWALLAAVAGAIYFAGFHLNTGHRVPGLSDLPAVLIYWLRLAGSSPALENVRVAPWSGALLVAATAFVLRRPRPHEKVALALLVWCLAALAMIAWGRALLADEWVPVTSRYVILSSIAWALIIWLVAERALQQSRAPAWWLAALFVILAAFNFQASVVNLSTGHVFAQRRELAVLAYHRDGTFAQAETPLYPDPERADVLIRAAQERGIFELPPAGTLADAEIEPVDVAEADEIADANYFIEEVAQREGRVHVRGWAFRPDEMTRLGDVAVVFRSTAGRFAFEALPQLRPDVAKAFERADAIYSGFDLWLPCEKLPAGEFGIGVCFDAGDSAEYMMTANTIVIPPSSKQHAQAHHAVGGRDSVSMR